MRNFVIHFHVFLLRIKYLSNIYRRNLRKIENFKYLYKAQKLSKYLKNYFKFNNDNVSIR